MRECIVGYVLTYTALFYTGLVPLVFKTIRVCTHFVYTLTCTHCTIERVNNINNINFGFFF